MSWDQVARMIRRGGDRTLTRRQAQVVGLHTTAVPHTVDLLVGGSDQVVPDVCYLDPYAPTIGDSVWVMVDGTDWIVLGKLAGT
jgi:hypothetical protein